MPIIHGVMASWAINATSLGQALPPLQSESISITSSSSTYAKSSSSSIVASITSGLFGCPFDLDREFGASGVGVVGAGRFARSVLPDPNFAHGSGFSSSLLASSLTPFVPLVPFVWLDPFVVPAFRLTVSPSPANGGAVWTCSTFFGFFDGSNGMYLNPKKNLPCGRTSAAGTRRSASDRDSGVMIRGPL